jgi:hypothetical protein
MEVSSGWAGESARIRARALRLFLFEHAGAPAGDLYQVFKLSLRDVALIAIGG